jgi:hypothetical protein
MISRSDVLMCREWATIYRERGLNPLPSRTDAKRPCCRFAQWWESPAPADLFEQWPTTNVQLMTGRHWRLLVIDLDGQETLNRWAGMGKTPRTWVTHSGGGGRHLWFRLPAEYPRPLPKAFVWRGKEHNGIERLCDRSLVMAPPSIHPATKHRYRFLDRVHSPLFLPLPADCPEWILKLQPFQSIADLIRDKAPALPYQGPREPVALARAWGVKIAGRASQAGWVPCHAIDRDDRHPSAAIHQESGYYIDHGSGTRCDLIELSIRLGVYPNRQFAISQLGQ